MLPPRFRRARRWQWSFPTLLATVLLFALAGSAAADPFYADLDHDGTRDVVTIQRGPSSGLEVWLSGSGRQIVLPTRRPVLRVAASDVDGDGHLDLLAADASAVHVWHRTHHGGLKRMRPRQPPRSPGVAPPTGTIQVPGERSGAVGTDGFSGADADTTVPGDLSPLDPLGAVAAHPDRPASDGPVRLVHPRGPPESS